MSEQRYLRLAGWSAVAACGLFLLITVVQGVWPSGGRTGREYLQSTLRFQGIAELQAIVWAMTTLLVVFFFSILAVIYLNRARQLTLSGLTMITGIVVFAACALVSTLFYVLLAFRANSDLAFGSGTADEQLIRLIWDAQGLLYVFGQSACAMALAALVVANRKDPVLPAAVVDWTAAPLAILNVLLLATLYVNTGPMSPAAPLNFVPTVLIYLWYGLVGATLLKKSRTPAESFVNAARARENVKH